jgi:hypothetical protein
MTSIRTILIVEVKAIYSAEEEKPVIPERHEGIDSGYQLAADVVEASFAFGSEGTPTVVSGRVRGWRLAAHGELTYADGKLHWMDLDIGRIPPQLDDLIGEMRAMAHAKWKATGKAK